MVDMNQIRAFVVESLLPNFNEEWFVHHKTFLLRIRKYCLQGISLYFMRNLGKLRTYYFVQLLTIPERNLHVTLGDSLKVKASKKGLLSLFRRGPTEFLFDWSSRFDIVDELLSLLADQIWPAIDSGLTPEEVLDGIREHRSGSEHETVRWSEGMLAGMCGDLESANRKLQALEQDLSQWTSASAEKPHVITDRDVEKLHELRKVLQVILDKERFDQYCQSAAIETIKNLKIPKKYVALIRTGESESRTQN
jgi:hypothetical protein